MSIEKLKKPERLDEGKLRALRDLFPGIFTEGDRIDYERLKDELAANVDELEPGEEHYGLNWPGKRRAKKLATMPPTGTLRPVAGEGVNEETTKNVVIEGDNLEVLRILQRAYAGRVKMIYIDPPYNTGNDFVYTDSFAEPVASYLDAVGDRDDEGLLVSNPRSSGRFHSLWLSSMLPRLRLARDLMQLNGLIFVSIDDNEVGNLRILMDEVFGAENFVEQIVWKNKYGSGALTRGFANVHEYIICYSRSPIESVSVPLDEADVKNYSARDEQYDQRGGYVTQPLATNSKASRPNLRYALLHEGKEIWPQKQWIWEEKRLLEAYYRGEIVVNEKDGEYSVRFKQYLRDDNGRLRRKKPVSVMVGPYNQEGTKEIEELFGERVFEFPKPVALLSFLASITTSEEDDGSGVYLDFYAGSGSFGEAIMNLNSIDGVVRQFMLVQWPELTPVGSTARAAGYEKITSITCERLRRAARKYSVEGCAAGFKFLELAASSVRAWQPTQVSQVGELSPLFSDAVSTLVPGWVPQNVIIELLLVHGFPLDTRIEQTSIGSNTIHLARHPDSGLEFRVCLDEALNDDVVQFVRTIGAATFVCLDQALDDKVKQALADVMTVRTI